MSARFDARQVVVSVEHANHDVPSELDRLGLSGRLLASHRGWDPGAAPVGQTLAAAFEAPLHLGRWSRLVADLNRSARHPHVVPRRAAERPIPANVDLDRHGRRARLDAYWRPYRDAVERDLDGAVDGHGLAFHLSIHSFVERLGGEERRNHFGLLYNPAWPRERALADRLHERLAADGYRVRRNYPYSGLDDGFCMRMRAERPRARYVGMEIEMNQRLVRDDRGAARAARALVAALTDELG